MSATIRKKRRNIDSLYVGKSALFKLFLISGVVIISIIFIWYTFSVIEKLKNETRTQVEKYVRMWQLAANSNMSSSEYQFIFDEIIIKATFPIIVLDDDRNPIHYRNIDGVAAGDYSPETLALLKDVAEEMVRQNNDFPLIFFNEADTFTNYFCYGDGDVINQLKMMPFIEIGIIVAFMLIAFIGFQNIRKSEERYIWVGMAKETAHQLGTPISSLMGWLEVMESEKEETSGQYQIYKDAIDNMKIDVNRLNKVANRFGKIGSIPELIPTDLNNLINDAVEYYRRRIPFEGKGVKIDFVKESIPKVDINQELFGWALENMIKNSLQTVDSKEGLLSLRTEYLLSQKCVLFEIKDNGKGISGAASRKIFRAGFTTKKRGWGLGLTLVKRIIEEYHGGRIALKKSKPGETIFEILLPVTDTNKDN